MFNDTSARLSYDLREKRFKEKFLLKEFSIFKITRSNKLLISFQIANLVQEKIRLNLHSYTILITDNN